MTRLRSRLTSLLLAVALPVPFTTACKGDDGLERMPGTGGNNPGVVDAGTDLGTGTDAGTDAGTQPTTGRACGTAGAGAAGVTGSFTPVRIVAANLTSGSNQSYDPGHGIRILAGLKPDVVMLQETNYGDHGAAAMRTLTDAIATGFHFCGEDRTGSPPIPNSVISRWPILECGEWEDSRSPNRDFVYARIDIPGPRDLWAVSVHLLTADASTRNIEGQALVAAIAGKVPAGAYLSIAGDLNTDTRSEPVFATLEGTVCTTGSFPVDQSGSGATNATGSKPYDHVLADGDLHHFQTATVIGAQSFPSGLVVDTREYNPLADLAPALATDSAAANMQHMAVVKDYALPLE